MTRMWWRRGLWKDTIVSGFSSTPTPWWAIFSKEKPLQVLVALYTHTSHSREHAFSPSASSSPPFLCVPPERLVNVLGTLQSCGDPRMVSPLTVTLQCSWTARTPAGWPPGDTPAGPGPPARSRLWRLRLIQGRTLEPRQENRCALWTI